MSEITIAGETFNVRLEGDESKPVLALAHQLGGSLAVWEPLMPALLEHFRVLRWDARGHGASVVGEGPYSIAQLARDAIAIFDSLGIEKAHWIGLSMGAIVGQAALIAAPERIGRAVLANTAAKLGTPDIWNARIRAARQEGMEAMAGAVAARWFTPGFREAEPEVVEAILFVLRETSAEGYAAACAALRDMDQREAIASIRSEALVIVGRDDPSAPPEAGAFVAHAIGARLATLDSSHISHIEQTEAFAKAAIGFLTAPEAPAQKPPARRAPAARPPARRLHARPAAAQAPRKKAAVPKAATRPGAAGKSPAKKLPAIKTPAKKAPAKASAPAKAMKAAAAKVRKAPVKPTPAAAKTGGKAPAGTAPVKKTAVKKTAASKAVVARKAAPAKAPARAAKPKSTPGKKPAAKTAASPTGKKAPGKSRPAPKAPGRR